MNDTFKKTLEMTKLDYLALCKVNKYVKIHAGCDLMS